MAKPTKKPLEAAQGRYVALPHALLDSTAFMGASHMARSLLFEVMRQHDGRNNGHIHLSAKWLKARGWKSTDSIQKSKLELLDRGLIVKTREGGLNAGPDRYALTWLAITNFVGLDIQAKDYQPGAYQLLGPFMQPQAKRQPGEPPPPPPPVERTSPAHVPPRKCHTAYRNSAAPRTGTVNDSTAPRTGTREAIFPDSLHRVPETMNSYHCTPADSAAADLPNPKRIDGKPQKRIVGKAKPQKSPATASKASHPSQHINASAYASLRADCLGVGLTWASRP
ncbi:MAG: hypothetical protein Q8L39_04225 [Burkholderiales bacterium]|nr:hypothetical protein [Burkholderiales bacterium]